MSRTSAGDLVTLQHQCLSRALDGKVWLCLFETTIKENAASIFENFPPRVMLESASSTTVSCLLPSSFLFWEKKIASQV